MGPFEACGIVRGDIQWTDAEKYLEACLYVAIHKSVAGQIAPGYITIAKHVADYAVDYGQAAALKLIRETKAEAAAKLPSTDLHSLAETKGWKKPL